LLAEKGQDFERRDYFKDPFTEAELRELFTSVGLSPAEVLSKRSTVYKELGLADRSVSEDELLTLMVEHPTLIRRPIVVKDGQAVIGFNKGKIEGLIDR
jgi:arsenate reductase (glutaredoxin)